MELPNRHLAYVPEAKITHYLLDVNHPDGWGKAQAFRGRGYNENNVMVFIQDLIALAQTAPVVEIRRYDAGIHYEILPPDGRSLRVRTIWRIDTGQDTPRLISAYPRSRIE